MLAVNSVSVYKKRFILSGSEDGNVRLWRLYASEKENMSRREENALECNQMLKDKYYHVGDVRRIDKHRFLPKELKGRIRNEIEHHKAVERKKNRALTKTQE
ncbi:Sof1-like rRNA processing protein (contains WD40 repeats) [Trachipleistophora hominis]|uniref:Sof1-like rRNA processing protein (Contains WD40 repeats) n=1 Tax=Trachipleistophora hominis TaxID=72359 RepID=L7JV14_TRAHO|nr:Sof1-like rRNA processing protein (contains WD40 repeats) [Trachipleistophora hominis]